MASTERPQSKRRLALDLCRKLLDLLDTDKGSTSSALQLLSRIAQLSGDKVLVKRVNHELDGFFLIGSSRENTREGVREYAAQSKDPKSIDIEKTVDLILKDFPSYRRLSLKMDYSSSFKSVYMTEPIAKYEELLDQVRRDKKTQYTYSVDNDSVVFSAAELNRLVGGARRWVYQQTAELAERLEFGEIPVAALETTFEFVDTQLFELMPDAAERLITAY